MILLDEDIVEAYALASLRWAGTTAWRDDADVAQAGFRVWTKAVGDGLGHLPSFLAMDLRTMAASATLAFPEFAIGAADPILRARYENEVLGRLLRHRAFGRGRELVEFHDTEDDVSRADRLAYLVLAALAPCWPQRFQVNAAHLRRLRAGTLSNPTVADVEAASKRWVDWQIEHGLQVADETALAGLVDAVRGTNPDGHSLAWDRLLQTQDLFELDHLPALDREHLRLGVRQILEVRESIPPLDPHDVHLNEEASEAETQFMDQSHYPTGGFSELTTRGSFENLVLSELIYMGEGDAGVDLFDLRYVEGELLYYSRDSGELRRKRRRAVLAVDLASPLDIRLPEHDHQLVIMVAGMLLALVRDLALLFFKDSLLFDLQLVPGTDPEPAARLREILSILLAGPIQHRLLTITVDPDADAWQRAGSATRKTYAVALSSGAGRLSKWAEMAAVAADDPKPVFATIVDLHDTSAAGDGRVQLARSSSGLHELHRAILEAIMNGRAARLAR